MFKKIILAALIVGTAAFAQINAKFGANAAFTFGTTWGENSDKLHNSWGPGFAGGLDAKIAINSSLSFITGLNFEYRNIPSDILKEGFLDLAEKVLRGYGQSMSRSELRESMRNSDAGELLETDFSFSFKYLDIPLMLQYNVNPQFFVEAGAVIGFNLSCDYNVSYEGQSASKNLPSDFVKTVEVSAVVGVGYSILPNLDFNLRFDMGLTDMVEAKKTILEFMQEIGGEAEYLVSYLESDYGFKNMRFQAGLTFWFN